MRELDGSGSTYSVLACMFNLQKSRQERAIGSLQGTCNSIAFHVYLPHVTPLVSPSDTCFHLLTLFHY